MQKQLVEEVLFEGFQSRKAHPTEEHFTFQPHQHSSEPSHSSKQSLKKSRNNNPFLKRHRETLSVASQNLPPAQGLPTEKGREELKALVVGLLERMMRLQRSNKEMHLKIQALQDQYERRGRDSRGRDSRGRDSRDNDSRDNDSRDNDSRDNDRDSRDNDRDSRDNDRERNKNKCKDRDKDRDRVMERQKDESGEVFLKKGRCKDLYILQLERKTALLEKHLHYQKQRSHHLHSQITHLLHCPWEPPRRAKSVCGDCGSFVCKRK